MSKLKKLAKKAGNAVGGAVSDVGSAVNKAGDAIAKATGLDKVSIPTPPPAPAPKIIENIGNKLSQGAQWVGDTVNDILAPGTSDRKPQTKISGPNPLEQERSMKQPLKNYGTVAAADTFRDKDFEGLQPLTSIPILDNLRSARQSPEGEGIPEEGVKVAANGVPIGFSKKQPSTLEALANKVTETFGKGYKKVDENVIEPLKQTWKEGTDDMNTKIFRFQYGGLATPDEVEMYRKASAAGDKQMMESLNKQLERRKQQRAGAK